jgi:phosphoribosylanthranilate isomerase
MEAEMTEVKICGITTPQEVLYLNRAGVQYAGFVFFEKSKRNVTIQTAKDLMQKLNRDIRRVAVTVSPDVQLAKQLACAGFDILQVHGELNPEILQETKIPIWRALNLTGEAETSKVLSELEAAEAQTDSTNPNDSAGKMRISAVLVDAPAFGSGKTFDWENPLEEFRWRIREQGRRLILAGGLTPENVKRGIEIFSPDIVDVSSGVEGADGKKSESLIQDFVNNTKKSERKINS